MYSNFLVEIEFLYSYVLIILCFLFFVISMRLWYVFNNFFLFVTSQLLAGRMLSAIAEEEEEPYVSDAFQSAFAGAWPKSNDSHPRSVNHHHSAPPNTNIQVDVQVTANQDVILKLSGNSAKCALVSMPVSDVGEGGYKKSAFIRSFLKHASESTDSGTDLESTQDLVTSWNLTSKMKRWWKSKWQEVMVKQPHSVYAMMTDAEVLSET